MSSTPVFFAIADFFQWIFQFFDWVQNKFNYFLIIVGFFGLFYWLWTQKKLNDQAANNPNQLK